jgi:hypothetical protein
MLFLKFHLLTSNVRIDGETTIGDDGDVDLSAAPCCVKHVNRVAIFSIVTNTTVTIKGILLKII